MSKELIIALTKSQLEIQAPEKDKVHPVFKSKYCSLDAIYTACRIPLAKNGLSLSHTIEMIGEKHFLRTILYHVSGESISTLTPMFIDKLTSQGYQSANTYARRSGVTSLLGLPTEEDDDGDRATKEQAKEPPISREKCDEISDLVGEDEELRARILLGYDVKDIGDIPAKHYAAIIKSLQARKAK